MLTEVLQERRLMSKLGWTIVDDRVHPSPLQDNSCLAGKVKDSDLDYGD